MEEEEEDLAEKLERVLARRQERLGVSRDEARQPPPGPSFLEAAQERAERLGYSVEELLQRDSEKMRKAPYPGPDCLQPDEVMAYFAGNLPAERLAHAASCADCSKLLAEASQPPSLPRELPLPETPRRPYRPPVWSPVQVAAVLLLAVGLFWWMKPVLVPQTGRLASSSIFVLSPFNRQAGEIAPEDGSDPNDNAESSPDWLNAACAARITSMLNGRAVDRKLRVQGWDRLADVSLAVADLGHSKIGRRELQRLTSGLDSASFVRCSSQIDEDKGLLRLNVEVNRKGQLKTASFDAVGEPAQEIAALAMDAGHWVIERLGIGDAPPEQDRPYRYAMPSDTEAARLYSQGLAQLASYRPDRAVQSLGQAVEREQHPLAYAALSEAWSQLGDANRERESAAAAYLAAGRYPLPQFEQLAVSGRYSESLAKWDSAIESYTDLERISPDPVGSGIRIAETHLATSDAKSALKKIEEIRNSSVSALDTARLDLLEAKAAEILSDPSRQRQAAQRAAARAGKLGARRLEAEASLVAGRAARLKEDLDKANDHFDDAERLFKDVGDHNGTAAVLEARAVSAWRITHEAEKAKDLLDRAFDIYRKRANKGGLARVQIRLGHVDVDLYRDREAAKKQYTNALKLFRELGNQEGIADALLSQGILLWYDYLDFDDAERHFEAALQVYRKISNKSGEARVLNNYGQLLYERGQIGDALEVLEKSLAVREDIGLQRDAAASHAALAHVLVYKGDLSEAEKHYDEALAIYKEIYGNRIDESPEAARIRLARVEVWLEQDRLTAADRELQEVRDLSRNLKMAPSEQDFRFMFAKLRLRQGEPDEDRAFLEPADDDNPRQEYEKAILWARIDTAMGQRAAAVARLEPLVERPQQSLVLLKMEARLTLAEAHLEDRKEVAQEELRTIQSEAEELGAHLLARKAADLLHPDD